MYSESEIDSAVQSGAITAEAAHGLRGHIAAQRTTPSVDEEHFRLLTGFNDIFVSIAAVILLIAVGWIGRSIATPVGGIFVAATAWGLAEYFTRVRRMALPSIVLLLAFAAGVLGAQVGLLVDNGEAWFGNDPDERLITGIAAGIGLVTAVAVWFHWRRFMVPITVAVGTAVAAGTVIAAILAGLANNEDAIDRIALPLVFIAGLIVFAFAMWWDSSDKTRQTRRSDVAFWLHLLAAPMIAHPLFSLLGVNDSGTIGTASAILVVAVYIAMGLIALAIDRRALLVSALAYVLYAMTSLFREFGAVELNVALTALVIGSALLLLSAFWQTARRFVVATLPAGVATRLPVIASSPSVGMVAA